MHTAWHALADSVDTLRALLPTNQALDDLECGA